MANSHRNGAGTSYAQYIGVGFTFVLLVAALAVGGYFLDRLLGTLPLFLLVGLALGFAGSLYYVYRKIQGIGDG